MALDQHLDPALDQLDNRSRALALRADGMTLQEIGNKLGISKQGVSHLLKTAPARALPVAKMERASRTLAELAESTRQALAETFEMGAAMSRRRLAEVQHNGDDRAATVVLHNAKLATDGAKIVHGWAETNGSNAGGRIAVGVITDLRGMKSAQVVDVEPIPTAGEQPNDSSSHQNQQEKAEKPTNQP